MKFLTITIPCYNSAAYMEKCIQSLLPGGDDVEILVVDDGSTDDTARIADEYQAKYPDIVRAIHQENGGHGEAVNAGIRNATGLYFKVVDSDDWVKPEAYEKILEVIKELVRDGKGMDMLISNFVYEKEGRERKKVMRYKKLLPTDCIFTWDEAKRFKPGQYLLMHSVIYRTKLLRDCGLELPKHTFYVDNLYVFEPLPYVKNMYYLDVNFYRYYIGRADQSVNEEIMISRIDQQLLVSKRMIDYMAGRTFDNRHLASYMCNYMDIRMAVPSALLTKAGTPEALEKKKELWKYLKEKDRKLYHKMRNSFLGIQTNYPGFLGHKVTVAVYKTAQHFFGFN